VSTLLKVDYDQAQPPDGLEDRLGHVAACMGARVVWYALNRSSGGRGWHMRVQLSRRLSPVRVVLAQALLGSDWRREGFNAARVRSLRDASPEARERWNVLYSRKWTFTL
jgi:hypothetical protein